jgi:5-dehydro-2-deoxygluconokinase
MLASDHRNSVERHLYRLEGTPKPGDAARIAAGKLLIFEALLEAAEQLPARARPGILIDEQYGASAAEIAGADAGIDLSMPIEASGHDWFEFAYGADWRRHAEFFTTDHAKVLIRDNPRLDPGSRARQAERLAEISQWAKDSRHPLIIELLVPGEAGDLDEVGGDADRYDRELRPRLTRDVIAYLQDRGVDPSIWKVEGLDRREDAVALVDAARRGGRHPEFIVLGRDAPPDRIEDWLAAAAPVDGFVGFAIGRTIWWEPLASLIAGRSTSDEARQTIAAAYLRYATAYLDWSDPAV